MTTVSRGTGPPSRERVLQRIRRATANIGPTLPVPRDYEGAGQLAAIRDASQTLALFEERLRDYDARVFPLRRDDVAEKAAEILIIAGRRRIAIPPDLSAAWRADGIEWIPDLDLSFDALNSVDGVMTAATAGVAASGSIVLQHGPAEGRRVLTLLPDYHLCVIEVSQVVETLPEAFALLEKTRPVTFFSGPSATADIEMTRIKGVHGPRFLDVLLVQD